MYIRIQPAKIPFEQPENGIGLLVRHEPHADLRLGARRNRGFDPRSRVSADKAMHLESRLGPDAAHDCGPVVG